MTKEALKLALEALETLMIERGSIYDKALTAIKKALANEALEKMAENARELGLDYEPAQPFITHNVEQPYDWSEWVCPDPKGYLMKCCDCGLVHEAEFSVVRYKSETEREDCDIVDDPNLQAVFRMRRSEEWTPEDTAHRSGGLPMAQPEPWEKFCDSNCVWTDHHPDCNLAQPEQHQDWCASLTQMLMSMPPKPAPCNCKPKPKPEQEPCCYGGIAHDCHAGEGCRIVKRMKTAQKTPQHTWVGLTDEEMQDLWDRYAHMEMMRAIEAKLKAKNGFYSTEKNT